MHQNADSLVLGPNQEPHRFCQKCHLVHTVSAFTGSSHICTAKLAQLKERRAARRGAPSAAAASPAGGSCDDQVSSVEEVTNWQDALLHAQQAVPDATTSAMVALLLASPPLVARPPPLASSSAAALQTLQRAQAAAGWPVPLSECFSVQVKLPAGGSPAAVLPANGMRHDLLAAFGLTLAGDASTGQPASASQLLGAVRPGCTLLTVDASLLAPPAADGVLSNAARVAGALYRAVPSLFTKQPRDGVRVAVRSSAAAGSCAHLRLHGNDAVDVLSLPLSPTPRPLKVRPLAVLSTAEAEVLLSGGGSLSDCTVHVRLNGQSLRVAPCEHDGDYALRFTVPAVGVDGCACLDIERAANLDALHAPLSHLLLCTDAAIVEEVAASAAAADALPDGPEAEAQHAALQRAVWSLGCALAARSVRHVAARTSRGDQRCLFAVGAATAIRFGWLAALDACLALMADGDERDTAVIGGAGGATLLHQAVHAGSGPLLDRVLAASPAVRGRASAPDAHGRTPVHMAARAGCVAALEALCCLAGGAERKADAASAVVAFSCAHDDAGATPANLAIAAAQRLPPAEAALLQACVGQLLFRAAAGAQAVNAAAATISDLRRGAASVIHLYDLVDARLAEVAGDPAALDAQFIGTSLLRQLDCALAVHDRAAMSAVAAASAAPAEITSADDSAEDVLTGFKDVRVFSLISCAVLVALQYVTCAVSRMGTAILPDETIRAFLPDAPWFVWLRIPTSMCCTGHRDVMFIVRCSVTLYAFAVAFVAAAQARSGGATRARLFPVRLKPSHLASAQLMLLTYVWILDPMVCGVRTNLRYAGTGHLRQPWQGGLRQLLTVLLLHAASGRRMPTAPYSALLLVRGILPLLVRAAETGPAVLAPLVQLRLLPDRVAWDVAHMAGAVMCVAHTASVHAQGRRRRTSCQDGVACAEGAAK